MSRFFASVVVGMALSGATFAPADQTWVGTFDDWNNPLNWSGGVVPTNEGVTVNNGGIARVEAPSADITWLALNNSSVEINNGGVLRQTGDLDFQSSAYGTLLVNNGGVYTLTGSKIYGGGTTIVRGTMNFGDSAATSWGRVGNNSAALTQFTIDGGTVNAQYTQDDGLVIGDYHQTTIFNMIPGSLLNMFNKSLNMGWWDEGRAYVTNDGGYITFTGGGGHCWIGASGNGATGVLVLANGAMLTQQSGGGDFMVGHARGNTDRRHYGYLEVLSGSILQWAGDRFVVGADGATGHMLIDGAGTVVDTGNNEFQIGNWNSSTGTVVVNNGELRVHSWFAVQRDGGGYGHLILNGGKITQDTGGYLQINAGAKMASVAVIDQNDGIFDNKSGTIRFQDWGGTDNTQEVWGTYNLNGGRLIAADIARGGDNLANNHAVFNFNGGILELNANRTIFHDLEAVNVQSGGAIIETAGYGTYVNQALLDGGGGGGLVVRGNGVVDPNNGDLNMVALSRDNTFTGGIVVSNAAYIRIGLGDNNTGDGSLGRGTTILLDNGGIKNHDGSTPIIGASRTITLGSGGGYFTIGWGDAKRMTVESQITGPGALYVNRDGGGLVLSNTGNDYAGNTRIGADGPGRYTGGWSAGLHLGASEVIPDGAGKGDLLIDGGYGGHLNMNGYSETINGLQDINGGRIYNSSGTDGTLTVGNNNANGSYAGTIENNVNIVKIGSGMLTLAYRDGNTNTYTGTTEVREGTLRINGTHTGGGLITVASGATLDGTGAAGSVMVNSGARMAPGNSIGTFTVVGDLTLNGTLDVEVDGAGLGLADLLNVSGALDISAGTVNFQAVGVLDDYVYVIASYGSLSGSDSVSVVNLPSGYSIDYAYGGNQIALIPEPASLSMLAALVAVLWIRRRLRG